MKYRLNIIFETVFLDLKKLSIFVIHLLFLFHKLKIKGIVVKCDYNIIII